MPDKVHFNEKFKIKYPHDKEIIKCSNTFYKYVTKPGGD
jgi:hypothetical protein